MREAKNYTVSREYNTLKQDYLGTRKLNHISKQMRKRFGVRRHHNPVSKSGGLDPLRVLDLSFIFIVTQTQRIDMGLRWQPNHLTTAQ